MALSITVPHRTLFDLIGMIRFSLFTAKPKDLVRPQLREELDLDRRFINDLLTINPDAIQCHSDLVALMSCYHSRY